MASPAVPKRLQHLFAQLGSPDHGSTPVTGLRASPPCRVSGHSDLLSGWPPSGLHAHSQPAHSHPAHSHPRSGSAKYPTQQSPSQPSRVRYTIPPDPDAGSVKKVPPGAVRYGMPQDMDTDSEEEVSHEQPLSVADSLGPGRPLRASSITPISPVEEMLQQLQVKWQAAAEASSTERAARLHVGFRAADQQLAEQLASISEAMHQKQADVLEADEQLVAQQLKVTEQRLQELQRSHDKAAAQQQQQVAKLQKAAQQEAARRKAETEAAAAEARAKREAEERQRQALETAARDQQAAAQAKAAAEQAKAAATAAVARPPSLSPAAPSATANHKLTAATRCMRCAPEALAFEKQVSQRMEQLRAEFKPLEEEASLKKARRDIEKKMTVHVQQVSGTLDQVARKCGDIYTLIAGQPNPVWRLYAMYMFASKAVKQWELVSLNNKAAFPLATVLVKVSTRFPELLDLTLGLLHNECCYVSPCAFVARDPATGAELAGGQLHRLLGYRELDDTSKPGSKVWESEETYMQRVEGVMMLYGAIVQVDEAQNPHGLEHGWHWLARFLNAIPASRPSAKALIFFLRAAGFAMHRRFRGQFIKMLKCMYDEYLPELAHSQEADIQSVRTLLEHYLQHGQYNQEPEGRCMPKIDMSSYQRA